MGFGFGGCCCCGGIAIWLMNWYDCCEGIIWSVMLEESSQRAPLGLPCRSTQAMKWQATSYF